MIKVKDVSNLSVEGICFKSGDGEFIEIPKDSPLRAVVEEACNLCIKSDEEKHKVVQQALDMIYNAGGPFICIYEEQIDDMVFPRYFDYPPYTVESNGLVKNKA